jgi:hypothetical protein
MPITSNAQHQSAANFDPILAHNYESKQTVGIRPDS